MFYSFNIIPRVTYFLFLIVFMIMFEKTRPNEFGSMTTKEDDLSPIK